MTYVCLGLIVLLVGQAWWAHRERQELLRRIQSPERVALDEAPKRPPLEHIHPTDDAAFKRLAEERDRKPVRLR